MSTLSLIRQQVYNQIAETSGDHLSADVMTRLINDSQSFIASLISWPRKNQLLDSTGVQITEGMGEVTLPTDWIKTIAAYIGDASISGDIKELILTREEVIKTKSPSWLETASANRGTPVYFFIRSRTLGHLYPHANTAAAVTGKKLYQTYVYKPADLSSDSDEPVFPLAYHDILKFYVASVAYDGPLSNPVLAQQQYSKFLDHHKRIMSESTQETSEGLSLQWAGGENVNDDRDWGIIP